MFRLDHLLELIFCIWIILLLLTLSFCSFLLLFLKLFSFLIALCLLGLCCSFVLSENSMCCLGNILLESNYLIIGFLCQGLLGHRILANFMGLLRLGKFRLLFRLVLFAWIVHRFDLFLLGLLKIIRWKIPWFVRRPTRRCK